MGPAALWKGTVRNVLVPSVQQNSRKPHEYNDPFSGLAHDTIWFQTKCTRDTHELNRLILLTDRASYRIFVRTLPFNPNLAYHIIPFHIKESRPTCTVCATISPDTFVDTTLKESVLQAEQRSDSSINISKSSSKSREHSLVSTSYILPHVVLLVLGASG